MIAGWSEIAGSTRRRAVIWRPGTGIVNLGTLSGDTSEAFDINDAGQVVGMSTVAGSGSWHAFMWSAETGMVNLGLGLGGDYAIARAINNPGQIVGTGEGIAASLFAAMWSGPWEDLMINFGSAAGLLSLRRTAWTPGGPGELRAAGGAKEGGDA